MTAGQSKGSASKAESGKVASDKAVPGKAVPGKAASGKSGSGKSGSAKAGSGKAVSGKGQDGAAGGDMDDLKQRFRDALSRKNGKHASANAEGAQATGKVHDAHGPASSRRSFRRKSGG